MTGELTGSTVCLRELTLDDWTDVHSYASLPEASRNQPWGPNTVTDSFEFVQTIIKDAKRSPRTRFVFAVFHLQQQKLVGAGEESRRGNLLHYSPRVLGTGTCFRDSPPLASIWFSFLTLAPYLRHM